MRSAWCALLGLSSGFAQAQVVTEFSAGIANAQPFDITAGPDGNLWFTESSGNRIGRITTGAVLAVVGIPTLDGIGLAALIISLSGIAVFAPRRRM